MSKDNVINISDIQDKNLNDPDIKERVPDDSGEANGGNTNRKEFEVKGPSSMDMKRKVTRGEVIEIIQQVVDNVNHIADYLMQDVNTLYAQHVFPFQIRQAVIEDILIEKGIITKEEIDRLAEERVQKLKEQAKEIKEAAEKEHSEE